MDASTLNFWLLAVAVIVIVSLLSRTLYVILTLGTIKLRCISSKAPLKVMVVAGSGGHTTELIRLLGSLSENYQPRIYIVANTDRMSLDKIEQFEKSRNGKHFVEIIPRSREVRQSYITSIASTLYAAWCAFPIVFKAKPDLILVNGPGTCIPVCAAGLLLRILGFKTVLQVYVESICRVEHLSLSGLIMYYFADKLLVQWPQLVQKYPRAEYLGRVV